MFSIEQIKAAHAKVKSGADFPKYVQDIIELGVLYYETDLSDGRNIYYGENKHAVSSEANFAEQKIAPEPEPSSFKNKLKAHQEGKTDYPQFCIDCADAGVAKWKVDFNKMTCTYFDKAGNEILTEAISF